MSTERDALVAARIKADAVRDQAVVEVYKAVEALAAYDKAKGDE